MARARSGQRRASATHQAAEIDVRASVGAAKQNLKANRQLVDEYQIVLLPLQNAIVKGTLINYNAMSVGVFQLLAAKREQIETAARYVLALQHYWIARAGIDQLRAGGQLGALAMAGDDSPP